MKRLLLVVIAIALAAAAYYAYSTNEQLKEALQWVFNLDTPNDTLVTVADTFAPPLIPQKETKAPRERIPKKLKRDKYYRLDEYARKAPKQYEKDIKTLVNYLIKNANTDLEKARVLFTWVATHIEYDDEGYNSGDLSRRDYSVKNVFESRKAVCEGFSNLYEALCKEAKLEVENISGYAKGYGFARGNGRFSQENHAWNAIKINGEWKLFDATWAAGGGIETAEGKLKSNTKFDPYWFDVHPREFIFTHLPKQQKWQLTNAEPLRLAEFEKLPRLDGNFFKMGFNRDQVFADATTGKVKHFIETYDMEFPLRAHGMPYTRILKRGVPLTFALHSDYAEELAAVEDGEWHHFKKDGTAFKLKHTPTGKEVKIYVKINWFDESYWSVMEYKVFDEAQLSAAGIAVD